MSDADPVTGLTPQDRQLIRDSWDLVGNASVMEKNGMEFLIQLLTTYPYMMKYFPIFQGMSGAELRADARFAKHAVRVMSAIRDEVNALDDPPVLVNLVRQLGKAHIKLEVNFTEFENLKQMFVPFLKSMVGSKCTDAIATSWLKLLTVQNALIKEIQEENE